MRFSISLLATGKGELGEASKAALQESMRRDQALRKKMESAGSGSDDDRDADEAAAESSGDDQPEEGDAPKLVRCATLDDDASMHFWAECWADQG